MLSRVARSPFVCSPVRTLSCCPRTLSTCSQTAERDTDDAPVAAAGGTIGDFFASLDGDAGRVTDPRYLELKNAISPSSDSLRRSWDEINVALEAVAGREAGESIPVLAFDEAVLSVAGGAFRESATQAVKDAGVVVVRGVVPEEEALGYKEEVREYIARNRAAAIGYPEDDPQVWEVYYAKSQIAARQHPNMLALQTALNRLWTAPSPTFASPVTYVDRMRIRHPGDSRFTLGCHVDGGSLERWEDAKYRSVYDKILQGAWKEYDPFDATNRMAANMDLYNAANACSTFRTWQGWLSLSDSKPGEGLLRVVPHLKEATAYFMLRPFLEDVANTPEICGALPGQGQAIEERWHKPLVDACVTIPAVRPGDVVFWHCDLIHAVESVHNGKGDSSVYYIPALPTTVGNKEFAARQLSHFERGLTPPDFPQNHCEQAFSGRATIDDLSEAGKRAMCV